VGDLDLVDGVAVRFPFFFFFLCFFGFFDGDNVNGRAVGVEVGPEEIGAKVLGSEGRCVGQELGTKVGNADGVNEVGKYEGK